MGKATIESHLSLRVKRWYAPLAGISAYSNDYMVGVETGSGTVDGIGKVTLGRLHKGKTAKAGDDSVKVL
jgi:hypothetical protein